MTPLRFQRIEELFAAASALPAGERRAYLDAHCDDAELRAEVEKLLNVLDSDATSLLDRVQQAAGEMGDLLSDPGRIPPIGQTLGPYRVVSLIGQGGMGEVAWRSNCCPTLDARDEARVRRFQQEARAASALNHPNIVTIHDFGQAGDVYYLATELVQGRTLRQTLQAGRLTRSPSGAPPSARSRTALHPPPPAPAPAATNATTARRARKPL